MFLLLINVNGEKIKHVTYHNLYSSRIRYWLLLVRLRPHSSKLIALLREAAPRRGGSRYFRHNGKHN